jgi:dUTP pyrophosphatase
VHLGTIDAGYRGELACIIEADRLVRVPHGQAIAQLVVAPIARCAVVEVSSLPVRDTRVGGFGSTDDDE